MGLINYKTLNRSFSTKMMDRNFLLILQKQLEY